MFCFVVDTACKHHFVKKIHFDMGHDAGKKRRIPTNPRASKTDLSSLLTML